jgi:hypothetical protein
VCAFHGADVLVARVRCADVPGRLHPDDPCGLLAAPDSPLWLPLSDCPARALVLLQQVGVQVDFAVVTQSAEETPGLGSAMGADVAALGNRITTSLVPLGLTPGTVSVTVRARGAMGPHLVYPCVWGGGGVGGGGREAKSKALSRRRRCPGARAKGHILQWGRAVPASPSSVSWSRCGACGRVLGSRRARRLCLIACARARSVPCADDRCVCVHVRGLDVTLEGGGNVCVWRGVMQAPVAVNFEESVLYVGVATATTTQSATATTTQSATATTMQSATATTTQSFFAPCVAPATLCATIGDGTWQTYDDAASGVEGRSSCWRKSLLKETSRRSWKTCRELKAGAHLLTSKAAVGKGLLGAIAAAGKGTGWVGAKGSRDGLYSWLDGTPATNLRKSGGTAWATGFPKYACHDQPCAFCGSTVAGWPTKRLHSSKVLCAGGDRTARFECLLTTCVLSLVHWQHCRPFRGAAGRG